MHRWLLTCTGGSLSWGWGCDWAGAVAGAGAVAVLGVGFSAPQGSSKLFRDHQGSPRLLKAPRSASELLRAPQGSSRLFKALQSSSELLKALVHLSEGLVFLTLTDSRKLFDQPSTHEGHNGSSVRGILFLSYEGFRFFINPKLMKATMIHL